MDFTGCFYAFKAPSLELKVLHRRMWLDEVSVVETSSWVSSRPEAPCADIVYAQKVVPAPQTFGTQASCSTARSGMY